MFCENRGRCQNICVLKRMGGDVKCNVKWQDVVSQCKIPLNDNLKVLS